MSRTVAMMSNASLEFFVDLEGGYETEEHGWEREFIRDAQDLAKAISPRSNFEYPERKFISRELRVVAESNLLSAAVSWNGNVGYIAVLLADTADTVNRRATARAAGKRIFDGVLLQLDGIFSNGEAIFSRVR